MADAGIILTTPHPLHPRVLITVLGTAGTEYSGWVDQADEFDATIGSFWRLAEEASAPMAFYTNNLELAGIVAGRDLASFGVEAPSKENAGQLVAALGKANRRHFELAQRGWGEQLDSLPAFPELQQGTHGTNEPLGRKVAAARVYIQLAKAGRSAKYGLAAVSEDGDFNLDLTRQDTVETAWCSAAKRALKVWGGQAKKLTIVVPTRAALAAIEGRRKGMSARAVKLFREELEVAKKAGTEVIFDYERYALLTPAGSFALHGAREATAIKKQVGSRFYLLNRMMAAELASWRRGGNSLAQPQSPKPRESVGEGPVVIATDGSASNNNLGSGIGAVSSRGEVAAEKLRLGNSGEAEFAAVTMGLRWFVGSARTVKVVTDSENVVRYFEGVEQPKLRHSPYVQLLRGEVTRLRRKGVKVQFYWVKGHSGQTLNVYADRLAGEAMRDEPVAASTWREVGAQLRSYLKRAKPQDLVASTK